MDIGGAYTVFAPKHTLYGDKFNPYLNNSSGMLGLYYERYLGSEKYAIKAGCAIVKQGIVRSLQIPIQLGGNIIGERSTSRINVGFVSGIGLNSMFFITKSGFIPLDTQCDISLKRQFYFAPHIGVNAAVNLRRFAITSEFLFHCFIPEFLLYKVSYMDMQNNRIVEYNTNRNIGMTLKFGLMYRFGRKINKNLVSYYFFNK
jgi:hypothetical protein